MWTQQHQKLRWLCRYWCMMEKRRHGTGKITQSPCQVPYYPGKPYGIWLPRPWPRIESLIPVEWHKVWQVVHSGCHTKGTPRKVWEEFWHSRCLSHIVYWQDSTNTKCEGCIYHTDQTCQAAEDYTRHGTFKGKIELKKYSSEEYDLILMAQCQQLYVAELKRLEFSCLRQKQRTAAMRTYLQMLKSPKLITEIIQPLTENKAMQTLDGEGHQ